MRLLVVWCIVWCTDTGGILNRIEMSLTQNACTRKSNHITMPKNRKLWPHQTARAHRKVMMMMMRGCSGLHLQPPRAVVHSSGPESDARPHIELMDMQKDWRESNGNHTHRHDSDPTLTRRRQQGLIVCKSWQTLVGHSLERGSGGQQRNSSADYGGLAQLHVLV